MERSMTPAMLTEIAAAECRPVHLLEVDFNPTIYLTDAGTNVAWNGNTYLTSVFLQFSDVAEDRELLIQRCTIGLTGVDQAIIALLLQDDYLGRAVRIRKAMLTSALQVIVDPCLIMDGRMDRPVIATDPESGTCDCSVDVISRWSPLARPSGRHTNDADQQTLFPGDRGFENIPKMPQTIVWGALSWNMHKRPQQDGGH